MKHPPFSVIFLLLAWSVSAQDTFQLAPPLLKYPSVFFSKEAVVEIAFAEPNTLIRYTLNGQAPTEHASIYTAPIRIAEHFTTLQARVFGALFKPSDVVRATFIKDGLPIKTMESTMPSPRYNGSGAMTLYDNKGGETSISANTWMGFQSDTVEIVIGLHKKKRVEKVLVDLLRDYGSWIFLPEKIESFAWDRRSNSFQFSASQALNQQEQIAGAECVPLEIPFSKSVKTDKIKLRLHLVKNLPDWHPGKGNKGWIFLDEIKVYEKHRR